MQFYKKHAVYLKSLSFAFFSGFVAFYLNIPLPWMLGPLFLIGLATATKFNIKIPQSPRPVCRAILGCAIGANFTPDVLERINEIGFSLIVLPIFILIMISSTALFLKLIMKLDLRSSIFGSLPGGLNEMVIIGKEVGVNPRTLILIHSTRIVVVVLFASIAIHFYPSDLKLVSKNIELFKYSDQILSVIMVSFFGYFIGKLIKLPGYTITGPMIFSAILHVLGVVNAMPIYFLIIIVQVILGSVLGSQFKDITLRDLYGPILSGIVTTIIALILLLIFVLILLKLDYDLLSIILSYSPGGQTEMNILALSVNADMVFISTHHMFRVFMVIIFAAVIQKLFNKINVD